MKFIGSFTSLYEKRLPFAAFYMCVTHDTKVAAKCSRVLYLVDGGIMGEKELGHFEDSEKSLRDRERELTNWLMEQGW